MSETLDRLVAVMDRLRSPGGCPWDGAQTHASLAPYLIEETYELTEAIDAGDRAGMREELGDVLLQVVFHARVAAEHPDAPFDLDDVAQTLITKLVHRHPHVFADETVDEAGLHAQWDRLKRAEKIERTSALDGVPTAMPALARAGKIASRARRAGLDPLTEAARVGRSSTGSTVDPAAGPLPAQAASPDDALGAAILALVLAHPDLDAEGALRRATARWESALRSTEAAGGTTAAPPGG